MGKHYFWQQFMQAKYTKWFTLIEILVAIALIAMVALGVSKLDFHRLSEKQKLDIELSKASNIIEETRNNALIWRWVDNPLKTPDAWKIEIDTHNESIKVAYRMSWIQEDYQTYIIEKPFSIMQINCRDIDWNSTNTGSSISLWYTGSLAGIDTWCDADASMVDIQIWNNGLNQILHIETLTNIIEVL